MKRVIAIILFAAMVTATLIINSRLQFANNSETTSSQTQTEKAPTYKKVWITSELGIPSAESYKEDKLSSRNPWDMILYNDYLYIGGGDWGDNTGPVTVWRYNLAKKEWESTGTVNDEAVTSFHIKDGNLIILGTDPKDEHDFGNYYVLNENAWETERVVPNGVHMFDIKEHKGETFFAIGTADNTQSPIKKTSDGINFTNVPFYNNDVEFLNNSDYTFSRCYALFQNKDKLYAFCRWNSTSSYLYGFFEYDGNAFNLIEENPALQIMSPGVNSQSLVDCWASFQGKGYFSFGTLYSTSDFKTLNALDVPNGVYVEDMLVQDDKLYLLTSQKVEKTTTNSDNTQQITTITYKNSVLEYTEKDGFKEVFSFDYGLNAMSFTKSNNTFYIGIGNYNDQTSNKTLNGMIIKVEEKTIKE